MGADSSVSRRMQDLSQYIAQVAESPLPANVLERAKVHFVDTMASMLSGSRLIPGGRALTYVSSLGGADQAGVVGTAVRTSAPHAALANGMFGHADETDDTIMALRLHPGTCIVPAVLAVAECQRLSGSALLRSMVLGYDVSARLLMALRLMTLGERSRHHGGSMGGCFGAGAACAALLGLSPQQSRHVLSYCAQSAAGLYTMLRDSHHIEKAYVLGGMPAHNGVSAALMVAAGFTGVDDVFSGQPEFLSTFSEEPDASQLNYALGTEYQILNCSIKRWSVGAPIQAPLQVLHELLREKRFGASDVERIEARMPSKQLQVVDNRNMPDICVQHLLAVMLVDGTLTFESAHDFERMQDSRVIAARSCIHAVGDPALEDPLRRWKCVMDVTLKDGRKIHHETMAAKGWFENPQTRSDIEEKALDLIEPVLGLDRSKALIRVLWTLDEMEDVRDLWRFVRTDRRT